MKKEILIIFFIITLSLTGCVVDLPKQNTTNRDDIYNEIVSVLNSGEGLLEVNNPNFTFPEEVNPRQIKKYFRIGDVFFALAEQDSQNTSLDLPEGFSPSFVGLLASIGGSNQWIELIQIKDIDPQDKNNPYYIWRDDFNLNLSVVDQGSKTGIGLGNMKVFSTRDGKTWPIIGCYSFDVISKEYNAKGDTFNFARELAKHKKLSDDKCKGVNIIALTNS